MRISTLAVLMGVVGVTGSWSESTAKMLDGNQRTKLSDWAPRQQWIVVDASSENASNPERYMGASAVLYRAEKASDRLLLARTLPDDAKAIINFGDWRTTPPVKLETGSSRQRGQAGLKFFLGGVEIDSSTVSSWKVVSLGGYETKGDRKEPNLDISIHDKTIKKHLSEGAASFYRDPNRPLSTDAIVTSAMSCVVLVQSTNETHLKMSIEAAQAKAAEVVGTANLPAEAREAATATVRRELMSGYTVERRVTVLGVRECGRLSEHDEFFHGLDVGTEDVKAYREEEAADEARRVKQQRAS
jgi:hypothetical protein